MVTGWIVTLPDHKLLSHEYPNCKANGLSSFTTKFIQFTEKEQLLGITNFQYHYSSNLIDICIHFFMKQISHL